MSTLVLFGSTVFLATASLLYLSRVVSAKRDPDVRGESFIHSHRLLIPLRAFGDFVLLSHCSRHEDNHSYIKLM